MFQVLGFVGGSKMPPPQEAALRHLLESRGWPLRELHHPSRGWSCELACRLFRDLVAGGRVVGHPELHPAAGSPACVMLTDVIRPPAMWLIRLRAIVDAADLVACCPDGPPARRESAWVAARYARREGKPVVIIGPDGALTEERTDGRVQRDQLDQVHVEPVARVPEGQ